MFLTGHRNAETFGTGIGVHPPAGPSRAACPLQQHAVQPGVDRHLSPLWPGTDSSRADRPRRPRHAGRCGLAMWSSGGCWPASPAGSPGSREGSSAAACSGQLSRAGATVETEFRRFGSPAHRRSLRDFPGGSEHSTRSARGLVGLLRAPGRLGQHLVRIGWMHQVPASEVGKRQFNGGADVGAGAHVRGSSDSSRRRQKCLRITKPRLVPPDRAPIPGGSAVAGRRCH